MIAQVFDKEGLVVDREEFKVVRKTAKAGESLGKHNHPAAFVVMTLVKGRMKLVFDDVEEHTLEAGQVLTFDGFNFIHPTFLEDSELVVTLITKQENF